MPINTYVMMLRQGLPQPKKSRRVKPMIIDKYDVKASSQRTYLSVESTKLVGKKEKIIPIEEEKEKPIEDKVSISDAVKEMHEKTKEACDKILENSTKAIAPEKTNASKAPMDVNELKRSLMEMILELLTGKKVKLKIFDPTETKDTNTWQPPMNLPMLNTAAPNPLNGRIVDIFEFEHFMYESEKVSYQAQAHVKTADGKTINVDISMYMSREFASYTNISLQLERPICDPLVINYGGTAASLTGEKFEFDLTMDGVMEKISMLGEGSGFLAVDWNGDGKINDGGELFGPRTGDGFSELRAYDQDKNGWIDEADDIFSKLVIWTRDKNGNDVIFTLKELGIGAIFLGNIDTQYSLKDDANNTAGLMRSTSFFLKEDGSGAGTVSHIDLMI